MFILIFIANKITYNCFYYKISSKKRRFFNISRRFSLQNC